MDADPFAGEYDTLLPGEAACLRNPDDHDIEHWIRVYAELVAFKEKLLDDVGAQRETVEAEGRLEVQHDDMVLRREYMRLKRRLEYWEHEKANR